MMTCDNFAGTVIREGIFNTVTKEFCLIVRISMQNAPRPVDGRKAVSNADGVGIFIILHGSFIWGWQFNI